MAPDFVKVYWRDAIVGDGTTGAEGLEHASDPSEPVTASPWIAASSSAVQLKLSAWVMAASVPNPR
ncbi:MAG: hypothetical protein VYE18_03680 [Pseudomonadota bacterium]|nr:hypothetical protein [Pseudomonadota bacterium]